MRSMKLAAERAALQTAYRAFEHLLSPKSRKAGAVMLRPVVQLQSIPVPAPLERTKDSTADLSSEFYRFDTAAQAVRTAERRIQFRHV